MWQSLKLTTKFSILLMIVFLVGAAVGGTALWEVLHTKAEAEVAARGAVLMETMNAVRSYTSNHVSPLLKGDATDNADQNIESAFVPEMIPAFSAREIFEQLRQEEQFEGFFYKEASLNPTNPRNQADAFEVDLLKEMEADGEIEYEYTDFRLRENAEVYYVARPMRVTSEGCLDCHGDPANAPAGLVEAYGAENGFNWQVGDVVAAQIVYVPADEVLTAVTRSFAIAAGGMVATLALVLVVVNLLLKRDILQPVSVLGGLARKLSADELDPAELDSPDLSRVAERKDELGHAAQVFLKMAGEVLARTQSLKQQVRDLRIEIDEVKQQQQVTELVETEFFQDLQDRAKKLRSRRVSGTEELPQNDSSVLD